MGKASRARILKFCDAGAAPGRGDCRRVGVGRRERRALGGRGREQWRILSLISSLLSVSYLSSSPPCRHPSKLHKDPCISSNFYSYSFSSSLICPPPTITDSSTALQSFRRRHSATGRGVCLRGNDEGYPYSLCTCYRCARCFFASSAREGEG
ncbi:hypothetical protein C8J57DRAFT_391505 [Mycena rebaudengoi]|nr:hypothetical protein C8J57DRAFT_391505 [Mycena rebaudengoi]